MTGVGSEMEDLEETQQEQGPNSDWETMERWTGGVANRQEMSGCQRKKGEAGEYIKALHHPLTSWKWPTLA
jgi:hypothetical protein